jgi:hypothetical protein
VIPAVAAGAGLRGVRDELPEVVHPQVDGAPPGHRRRRAHENAREAL